MQNFERISKTLPTTFDYSNWHEYMRQTNAETDASNNSANKGQMRNKQQQQKTQITTLQKARELAGRQGPQHMSAQLKNARQLQNNQRSHARHIAQQAAAIPANGTTYMATKPVLQKKSTPDSCEGNSAAEPASPPLPTPSSPPQMKTFAPPPAAVARTNSLPVTQSSKNDSNAVTTMPALTRYTSAPSAEAFNDQGERGTKRKASELTSGPGAKRSINFSPSKAINAARNSVGAVQQLFKSKSPEARSQTPMPNLSLANDRATIPMRSGEAPKDEGPVLQRAPSMQQSAGQQNPYSIANRGSEAQVIKALEDGHPIKFCYNCGNIQTRGNWRQLEVHGVKHNLCNACGVYWKTNNRMRPQNLWNRAKPKEDANKSDFPSHIPPRSSAQGHSDYNTPVSSDADQFDNTGVAQTSPIKAHDRQILNAQMRAIRSSPVAPSQMLNFASPTRQGSRRYTAKRDARPRTPTRETLHEIHPNTPAPPSPSPAHGKELEEFAALLATPKKQLTKMTATPSPWKSMFDTLTEVQRDGVDSPSRQKLDKFLEELNASDPNGACNFDFDALANFAMSPSEAQNFDSIASFFSSPSGMKIFTSSASMENDNSTPEDLEPPITPSKLKALVRTPIKTAQRLTEHFEEGDSLFTPKRHNTRSQPNSVQRNLRSTLR